MGYETILYRTEGAVAYLTLNRPERANTINGTLSAEVNDALDQISADPDLRAVILTGAGKHFCGGADLREMGNPDAPRPNMGRNFITHFEEIEVPVIAAINGAAMGGGCEIALACDIRVMSETAQIGLPEIRFGALPAGGGTQRLPRLVGPAVAKELILSGLPLRPEQALQIGLVNRVVPADELMQACGELAAVFAERAPFALAAAKFLINRAMDTDLATGLQLESRVIARMATAQERADAIAHAASTQPTYANIFRETPA